MKKIFKGITVLGLSMALLACSSKSKSDKIEIRLLTRNAGTSETVTIYKEILKEFEEKHPNVKIIDESQGDESAFNNKLKSDIASGTMPNIFRIQGVANLEEYAKSGILMDMEPVLNEDEAWSNGFVEGALNYYKIPGMDGIWGIPYESGLIGVYYNEKLFKDAGVNEFPKTWDELLVAIDKLNAINITPIALGAKSTYTAGHLHAQIFYKWLGVEAAKKIGNRSMKWTDPEVIKTLEYMEQLNKLNAFGKDAAGNNDQIAITEFYEGKAAMIITGPWNINGFNDPEKTKLTDDFKLAKFPSFKEKPEFKDDDMQIISPYMLSGKLEGEEKELTIELLKMLTSAEAAKEFAERAQFTMARNDVEMDTSSFPPLLVQSIDLSTTSKNVGVDIFDFDPLSSMQDKTRNAIVNILIGGSAKDAAEEIQAEIK